MIGYSLTEQCFHVKLEKNNKSQLFSPFFLLMWRQTSLLEQRKLVNLVNS